MKKKLTEEKEKLKKITPNKQHIGYQQGIKDLIQNVNKLQKIKGK